MKLFRVFLVFGTISIAHIWAQKNKISVQRLDYKFDVEAISNMTCKFKGVRNKVGMFNVGVTVIRPINQATLDVQVWDKNSANIFHEGAVHVKTELCDLDFSEKNLVLKFIPVLRDILVKVWRPCPFLGTFQIVNYTVDSFDAIIMNPFAATSDHRMTFKFIDTERKSIFSQIDVYWHFRGKTMSRKFT